jgi:integrase/recombinase XerC
MTSIKIAFRDYLVLEKNYSLHTQKAYCDDVDAFEIFLNEACLGVVLEQVAYAHIRAWVVFLVDSGLNNISLENSYKQVWKIAL